MTRILFFTTPILWTYSERTGLVKTLADINPFTHFVEIIRAPVIGDPLQPLSWAVVGAITLCGWTVTILTGDRMRKRLPFWV
jgi:ABC-type polysaccharide/polyol phosphate export permease